MRFYINGVEIEKEEFGERFTDAAADSFRLGENENPTKGFLRGITYAAEITDKLFEGNPVEINGVAYHIVFDEDQHVA